MVDMSDDNQIAQLHKGRIIAQISWNCLTRTVSGSIAGAMSVFLVWLGLNALLVLESLTYGGALQNHFGIEVMWLVSIAVVAGVIYSWRKTPIVSSNLVKLNWPVLIITGLLTIWLSRLELAHHPNYVFNLYHVHYNLLARVFFFSQAVVLLALPRKWWQRHIKTLIALFVPFFLFNLWIIHSWPMDYFLQIVKEDRQIEYAQFFTVIIAGVLAGQTSIFWRKISQHFSHWLFFALISMVLLFIGLDEISFGQRLFGIETPDAIAQRNFQEEITVHNLDGVKDLIGQAYIIVGLYGGLGWVVEHVFRNKVKIFRDKNVKIWLDRVIPKPWLSPFFITISLFNIWQSSGSFSIGEWSEVTELLLYLGILLHVYLLWTDAKLRLAKT